MTKIAVIGGGLAGAALVLALRREGQDAVTWYADQRSAYQPQSQSQQGFVQLPPNASRVLQALGLRDQLPTLGLLPQSLLHRAAGNSFVWTELPLGSFAADRFKAPFLCAAPGMLAQRLAQESAALPGALRNTRPTAATAAGEVQEADGSTSQYDLVVLASGADTVLCPELQLAASDADADTDSGASIVHRGVLPLSALPPALAQPVLTRWSNPLFDLWTLPVPDSGQLLLQLHPPAAGTTPQDLQTLAAALPPWARGADWHPACQQRTDAPQRRHSGRVLLCGSAAHRLPLSSGMSAALALEDAWVLSRLIDQNDNSPAAIGAEFERFRAPRSRQLRLRLQQERARWFSASAPGRSLQRLRAMLTHRFLPEFAYQELDWLYGYDCVRGFR